MREGNVMLKRAEEQPFPVDHCDLFSEYERRRSDSDETPSMISFSADPACALSLWNIEITSFPPWSLLFLSLRQTLRAPSFFVHLVDWQLTLRPTPEGVASRESSNLPNAYLTPSIRQAAFPRITKNLTSPLSAN
ncbi:uncharacterized protein CLUP02_10869 [Colletotrichum lupini]|uniref:Uncharacterized protein n=1 Tax=Colletotrichum lupini TaxID=145971 RepID=A0A9Q8WJR9_9PEZI|nr:uncharacterized protein CLUP02_10869 [Colletotrichum lupini]UQC85372.1 hypothetical protein CLUP02_10869 [Colletotrichum lupini]